MEEGELPMGIFPIIRVGFDELTTSPRAQSIIKQLRPYQAECNRCASKISETQITIGDDKIVITNGGRVSPGATAHGVKVIKCIGGDIKHLPGRSGDQYLAYMQQQISEMYQVANINEEREQKVSTNDPISQLFASVKDKKRFSIYSDKWGEFQKEWTMMSLRMTKEYYSEDMLIPIVGKREYVNIVEYKSMDDLSYEIVCEEQSEDVESKMGRHITLGNILQYVGNSLEPRDLGAIIRAMPYFNDEVILRDLTLDYDNVTNDILAMDRGEYIPAEPEENHAYIIKHLNRRMKEPEFKQLDMQIQQNYMRKKQEHVMLQQKIQEEIQRAQAGFIPTGGYLVDIGYYIADPSNPMASPRRAKVPAEAVTWLMKKLEEQGSDQDRLQQQQDMAVMQMQQQSMGLPAPQGNVGMVQ
jgi:hypothetical protein